MLTNSLTALTIGHWTYSAFQALGEKSLREVKAKLANLGLTLGMTLVDESYRAAVVATVAARIQATEA